MNKAYNRTNEWLNSGEYFSDIDDMRTTIMRDCMASENEATTASIFEEELYYLIRSRTGIKINYEKEKALKNIHKFSLPNKSGRGRMDAVVNNNLVIEYKHNSKLKTQEQIDEAIGQVVDYLYALYSNENKQYNAILTDGIKIGYFSFVGDKVCFSALSTISVDDIDYSLNKSNLHIPLFDKSNPLHRAISNTAYRASTNAQNIDRIQKRLSYLYLRICEEK